MTDEQLKVAAELMHKYPNFFAALMTRITCKVDFITVLSNLKKEDALNCIKEMGEGFFEVAEFIHSLEDTEE